VDHLDHRARWRRAGRDGGNDAVQRRIEQLLANQTISQRARFTGAQTTTRFTPDRDKPRSTVTVFIFRLRSPGRNRANRTMMVFVSCDLDRLTVDQDALQFARLALPTPAPSRN
jgi:hypothetical protein